MFGFLETHTGAAFTDVVRARALAMLGVSAAAAQSKPLQ
jgi:hypothetical protein